MKIAHLRLVLILLLIFPVSATPGYGAEVTVRATGVADSIEGAKKALVLDAITRVTTTFVMAKERVVNEDLESRVATFSDGIAKRVRINDGPKQGDDGLWRVGGEVVVVRRNLVDSLRKEDLALSPSVRSDELFARAASLESLQEQASGILDILFEEDPRRYVAQLVGELSSVPVTELTQQEVDQGGIHWVKARVGVGSDFNAYREEYYPRLKKVLEAITTKDARYEGSFGKIDRPKAYVYPILESQDEVRELMKRGFREMSFGTVTDLWEPPRGTEHIYSCLFFGDHSTFGKKVASLPVFSSRVKWIVASMKRPYVGYNVSLIGADLNGFPTLNCYAVAPAFFGPFNRLLNQSDSGSADGSFPPLVVTLKLIGRDDEVIRDLRHPIPEGSWLRPALYAGRSGAATKHDRVVLTPFGMSPAFCDALEVKRVVLGNRATMEQSMVTSFSAITNAVVDFRFPLSKEELGAISSVRVRVVKELGSE